MEKYLDLKGVLGLQLKGNRLCSQLTAEIKKSRLNISTFEAREVKSVEPLTSVVNFLHTGVKAQEQSLALLVIGLLMVLEIVQLMWIYCPAITVDFCTTKLVIDFIHTFVY